MASADVSDPYAARILELAKSKPGGISNDDIKTCFGEISAEILQNVNKLIQSEVLEVLKKGETLIYRYKDPSKKSSVSAEMDNDERIIYNIIEAGGNTGIWVKEIRTKSNLMMTPLTKILKTLENRKLIKAVKSVNASKKKVYMLYDLEPARSITGGAWYQDSDFEAEYVDVLNQQCLRFLQQRRAEARKLKESPYTIQMKSLCTVEDVRVFIKNLGISKLDLGEEDLETILKIIVYDGRAQRILQTDGSYLYKATDTLLPAEGIVQNPCGICPVIQHCSDVGSITPKSCVYMNEWLE